MWQVIYNHLNYSHLHWLGIFSVDKEYKRKLSLTGGRQRKALSYIILIPSHTLIKLKSGFKRKQQAFLVTKFDIFGKFVLIY